MALAQVNFGESLQQGLTTVVNIVPALLAFLAILIVGYLVAKLIAKAIDAVLERVGFDRAVERGGVRRALERTDYDASDVLSRIVFYALMLFVLQLAFGVFGDNAVSDLIAGVIAFLPQLFVAIVIIVIASAIGAGAREIVQASLGGLSYGRVLANLASVTIIAIGVFAALNQLQIAPAIVNGLFYALLAIVAGSAIIAIGGGGIMPMRRQWERAMDRVEDEAPRLREQVAEGSPEPGADAGEPAPTPTGEPRSVRHETPPTTESERSAARSRSLDEEAENAAAPGRRRPPRQ